MKAKVNKLFSDNQNLFQAQGSRSNDLGIWNIEKNPRNIWYLLK